MTEATSPVASDSPVLPKYSVCDDIGKLILRVGFAVAMMTHGWSKWQGFEGTAAFMDGMLGLPGNVNAALAVGAELGCAGLLVIGLLTRLASLPLIFTMGVAIWFHVSKGDGFSKTPDSGGWESAFVYLVAFVAVLCLGPGRFSIDHLLFGKRKVDA